MSTDKREPEDTAFPIIAHMGNDIIYQSGMTLRDYFAAKAMNAIVTGGEYKPHLEAEAIALKSYVIADAMMDRRKKIHDDESKFEG